MESMHVELGGRRTEKFDRRHRKAEPASRLAWVKEWEFVVPSLSSCHNIQSRLPPDRQAQRRLSRLTKQGRKDWGRACRLETGGQISISVTPCSLAFTPGTGWMLFGDEASSNDTPSLPSGP